MKVYIFPVIVLIALFCTTTSKIPEQTTQQTTEQTIPENHIESLEIVEEFQEEQPRFPVEGDDDFFQVKIRKKLADEIFRVLITKNNYQVRQLAYGNYLKRIRDVNGDKEQLTIYQEYYQQIDFKDWDLEGIIRIRLNPQTSRIESLRYEPEFLPKTQQATKLFIEDIARYRFQYLRGVPYPTEFLIRILWRVRKDPHLTKEEAKQRAIEYLKTQIRRR